jgi:glycerophosphoryl diester phosphodiesterase
MQNHETYRGCHPYFRLVNEDFIKTAHEKDLFVNVWTVDEPKDWSKLIQWDVDGIITNNPRGLVKFLEK